jgi:hypothetical protein
MYEETSDLGMLISVDGLPDGSSWGIDNISLDLDNAPVVVFRRNDSGTSGYN